MREIKYRAIARHSGEWVYGVPFTSQENNFTDFEAMHVCDSTGYWRIVQIIPDTLCQYTGLKDNSGKKIFEGDLVTNGRTHAVITFEIGCFNATFLPNKDLHVPIYEFNFTRTFNVIGSIHEREVRNETR